MLTDLFITAIIKLPRAGKAVPAAHQRFSHRRNHAASHQRMAVCSLQLATSCQENKSVC